MLISHKHQFIFVKTRKTAGTSVELALTPHLGPDDVITELPAEFGQEARNHRPRFPVNRLRPSHWYLAAKGKTLRYYDHMPAEQIRKCLGRKWDRYLTFAIDRNPWDLAVSAYSYRGEIGRSPLSFDDFVMSDELAHFSPWRIYAINDQVAVNHVIRYDRLDQELRTLTDTLGLPPVELPHANSRQRSDRRPYQEWYTPTTRDRAAEVFHKEIEAFEWTFD